jgi:hypothetical protein
MTFFYDLNKRLADLADKQDAKQLAEHTASVPRSKSKLAESMGVAEADYSAKKAAAGKDIGKPGKNFSKIAKSSGGGEKGQRIAGAVLAKLRSKNESTDQDGDVMDYLNDKLKDFDAQQSKTDESALQAYLGKKKYGNTGMKALQKAGREGASKETMARIRAKHDKMDEADMEEGNAFTAALKSTPKGGKFKVGGKEFTDTSDLEEGFADMNAWLAQREKEKGTGRFDRKERTLPSGMKATTYTRKPETFDDPETDPEATGGAPKRRGRPKGKDKGPERVTAKSYKYKAGRPAKTAEGVDHGEYDREGDMAKEQMHTIMSAAKELHSILRDEENLPEWVQKKITLAKEYIDTARDYMLSQHAERAEEQPIAEKAVSVAQRRAAGIAHAAQKGEIPKKELRGASKEMARMPKGELKKFAKTKEAGLPKKADEGKGDGNLANNAKPYDKVTQGDVVAGRLGKDEMGGKKMKEEKVDETTVAGSVATAPAISKKSAGGMQFGKGVYEGFNNQVESMITESMSVNVSVDDNGQKSINITATDEDAEMLSQLLKMAGVVSAPKEEVCSGCGSANCGCDQMVDENSPDWPTNTETSNDALQYSGGLNGPKSTGQTTIPVIASQLRRQVSMEENVELERSLFKTWQNYKG